MGRILSKGSLAQNIYITRVGRALVVIGLVVVLFAANIRRASGSMMAAGPDVAVLQTMAETGQGQIALQQVAAAAAALGGWGPAPGDVIVFDYYLSRGARGAIQDFDEMPYNCADPSVAADEAACRANFQALEQQVRFGPSLFSTPDNNGGLVPRPSFDDLLSTYIEEVGHSWQEYLYETDGRGGARTRLTTLAESYRWAAGREYQIKRYILSLDGYLLSLSSEQRGALRACICGGYADPTGHEVPPYGAPAGWPNPQGWPVMVADYGAFCG